MTPAGRTMDSVPAQENSGDVVISRMKPRAATPHARPSTTPTPNVPTTRSTVRARPRVATMAGIARYAAGGGCHGVPFGLARATRTLGGRRPGRERVTPTRHEESTKFS